VSTLVKVMQKKPWPLFFRTRCRTGPVEAQCRI